MFAFRSQFVISCPLCIAGGPELLERLRSDTLLIANARAKSGIEEMGTLFTYLDAYGVIDKVSRCLCVRMSPGSLSID